MLAYQFLDYLIAVPDVTLWACLATFGVLTVTNLTDDRARPWTRILRGCSYTALMIMCVVSLIINTMAS